MLQLQSHQFFEIVDIPTSMISSPKQNNGTCMHEAWNTSVEHRISNEPVTAAIINASNDVMTSPLVIRTNAMASRLEDGYNVEGFVAL